MISITDRRRPRLETVRRRLDRWRRTRAHARAPLPEALWAAAAALVPEHGLYGTTRALGVSYGSLKRHVDARHGRSREHPRASRARFGELPSALATNGYVIEIEGAAGTTLRVRLSGLPISVLADFARRVVGVES